MSASDAHNTFGVILKKETSPGGGTYSDWGLEVTNITGLGFTQGFTDVTHHQSPNGWAEMLANGVYRQKPFTIEFNYLIEDAATIKTAMEAGIGNWQFAFPDGGTLTVAAGISDFSDQGFPVEGKMGASAEFTPTGEPTWTGA